MNKKMGEYISIILNFVFGSGLIAVVTIKATRKKADEEARSKKLANDETILENQEKYIVEPLVKRIEKLEKNQETQTEEIVKLRKAFLLISKCIHANKCPIKEEYNKLN